MMPTPNHHQPTRAEFDSLFRDLANTWMSHQGLKASRAPLAELADSNTRLYKMRMAMGSWNRQVGR